MVDRGKVGGTFLPGLSSESQWANVRPRPKQGYPVDTCTQSMITVVMHNGSHARSWFEGMLKATDAAYHKTHSKPYTRPTYPISRRTLQGIGTARASSISTSEGADDTGLDNTNPRFENIHGAYTSGNLRLRTDWLARTQVSSSRNIGASHKQSLYLYFTAEVLAWSRAASSKRRREDELICSTVNAVHRRMEVHRSRSSKRLQRRFEEITLGPFVAFRHGVVLSLHTQFGYFTEIRVEMSDMLMKICFIGFKREEERLQCVDTQVAGNPEGSEKPNKKVWKQSLTPCLFSVIPVSACARENSQYLVERIKRAN
ncbi:hypothetical protein PAXINDRAFT_152850 [Paxillus involutus ATCC 200175]|nr:hypothetical protein PAXINDRAFT_152850 [Paxillus involutus ATCC 200175]